MPPSLPRRAVWAGVLSMGLCAAAPARAEEPVLCDARALGPEAQRAYESGVSALRLHADEALPALRRVLELEPRAAVARMVLGSALAKTGQTDAAAREYASFISACPEHPRAAEILRLLTDFVHSRKQAPQPSVEPEPAALSAVDAAPPLEGALCEPKLLPAPARERYEEAERHLKEARFSEAASALRGALALEPKAAAAHLLLGTAYARLGEAVEGARAYATFVAACPEHPKAPVVRKLLAEYRGAR
ncbi:tetratricopeptide repeat protein [Myxococcaceae bacterium GXIMD 01537]